jgi:hypothetical protein
MLIKKKKSLDMIRFYSLGDAFFFLHYLVNCFINLYYTKKFPLNKIIKMTMKNHIKLLKSHNT